MKKNFQLFLMLIMGACFLAGCKKINADAVTAKELSTAPSLKLNATSVSDDFMVATLPDIQYYTDTLGINGHGPAYLLTNGVPAMLQSQVDWIKNNRIDSNIAFIAGLGDIVDHGDDTVAHPHEWKKASQILYGFETPFTAPDGRDFPQGMPYGLAVGNHDQTPNGHPLSGTTSKYNAYFGVNRFSPRGYYGSHYGSNNDSHYDFFSVNGVGYLVVFIEYDDDSANGEDTNGNVLTWAYNTIGGYLSRKVIVVSHSILNNDGTFTSQGQRIYDRLKSCRNVFLMLGGHVPSNRGAYRQDTYQGSTIKTILSDWQHLDDGGGGMMRTLKFTVTRDLLSLSAFSPYSNTDSQWFSYLTKPLFHQETASRKCDFNQDGKTELGFYNTGGIWKINGMTYFPFGATGDIPAPADYDGDGSTDFCVFRPSNTTWFVKDVSPNTVWGLSGDIPVPADYDGDGKAEFAVWRPATRVWYVYPATTGTAYGQDGDIPVPGDYDGDGKVDFAIWRPGSQRWHFLNETTGGVTYGLAGDVPVPGDYNGDGITDFAVFRPSTGKFYLKDIDETIVPVATAAGDIPAPGDYDGTGRTQPAVYRPSTHLLYVYHWASATVTTVNFAGSNSGDKLLNLPYHIRNSFYP